MNKLPPSSRRRFEAYKSEFHDRNGEAQGKLQARRERSALALIQSFSKLLRGHRGSLALALLTLSIGTLLSLIPPAATKFVVDYVLGGKPVPEGVPAWVPREPWPLLLALTTGVMAISWR